MGRRAVLAAAAVSIMFVTGVASGASTWGGGAPVNLALPSISGTPQVGLTLTARYGKWRGKNLRYAYAWLRCDSTGGNCSALGVAQSTYVLVSSDAGATIRVAVTVSNQYGSTIATTAATATISSVPPPPAPTPVTAPANTAPPTISGSAQQAQTLTVTPGSWSGSTPLSYAYQWQRCDSTGASCAPLAATSTGYLLAAADVGSTIRVSVTAGNSAGSTTATSAPTAAVTALPVSVPAPAPSGTVFCFGDPTFSTLGFLGNYTQNSWGRQYPFGHPERVSYDDSVGVMQSLGCHTVRAELQAGDKDTNGGTTVLRAQTYKDPNQALYDAMSLNRGQTSWYGTAFSTNPGYIPQSNPSFPNWNLIFTWHSTGEGAGNPVVVEVATKGYGATCTDVIPFADGKPRLMMEVNGGDPAKYPSGGATCVRVPGPVFVAGHVYRMQEKITWSDNYQGAVEWWVDGVKYADISGVCTMQLGNGVWPLFENYRPYAASFPTADVYYGGLVKGSTQAAVTVP